MKTLVFDIGGTNFRYAIMAKRLNPILVPVPRVYDRAVDVIASIARSNRAKIIVGGLPGPMDRAKTMMLQSTHLPNWSKKPFKQDLVHRSGARVFLENDSALVALGEATHGAGRGYPIVMYIGVGTGIGGARIVNGRIDANAHGFEPGHHVVDWNVSKHKHPSPHPGDWESFVSGSSIFHYTGRKSETISGRHFWHDMEVRLARGLINACMFWSPDVIVLGGSLMKKISVHGVTKQFSKYMRVFTKPIPIKKAKLGDWAGLYGAMRLLK